MYVQTDTLLLPDVYENFRNTRLKKYELGPAKLYNNLPFLLERMKVKNVKKLAANLHYKTEHVIHIGNLKQGLTHRFVF